MSSQDPYGQQPYGQQPGYPAYPPMPQQTSSRAVTSLVLGIISLVACGFLLGIPAMVVGRRAKREIAASGGRLGGEGLATAGFWTGLISTVLSGLAALLVVALLIFGGITASSFSSTCSEFNSNGTTTSSNC